MTRIVKIFLSSPSDVAAEQKMVVALAAEINDVIAFLAPSLDVRLEILRYQDDVFPDVGKPQDVVDKQIPQDFDIFLGIMWMRCGMPTADAPSGTVHEFRQAMKRREATGRPIIMFYFSGQPPAAVAQTVEELDQMKEVLLFKKELEQIGLTMVYPDRDTFRERARGGLLRAVSDLLNRPPLAQTAKLAKEAPVTELPGKMDELAKAYDAVRVTMKGGPERTERMTDIAAGMVAEAPTAIKAFDLLKGSISAGERLAAIAILRAFPREDQLDWLADRLHPEREKPFVGFQAATSIAQAVRSLPPAADTALQAAIEKAMKLALLNPDDPPRIRVLQQAQRELKLKQRQRPVKP